MADKGKSHISVRFGEAVGCINEALRLIEAYTYDAKKEPKALLDIEKDTKNNKTFMLNEKLLHKHTKGRTINGLKEIFKEKTGKEPSKDATVRTTILTMPINEIKGLDFNLTMQEAIAIEKYNAEESLDAGDEKALKSAKKKLIHLEYNEEQMEQIHMWVRTAIKAICKVNGVKESDILYATLHCNGESSPHLHLGFVPSVYLSESSKKAYDDYHRAVEKRNSAIQADISAGMSPADARALHPVVKRPRTFDGDTNREIADDEIAYGSSANRFNKGFLKYYLDNIQREMRSLGVQTTLRNGHGHTFDVTKKSHEEREEEKFKARIIEMNELLKKQNAELKEKQIVLQDKVTVLEVESAETKEYYEAKISSLEARVATLKAALASLRAKVEGVLVGIKNTAKSVIEAIKTAGKERLQSLEDEASAEVEAQVAGVSTAIDELKLDAEEDVAKDIEMKYAPQLSRWPSHKENLTDSEKKELKRQKEGFAKGGLIQAKADWVLANPGALEVFFRDFYNKKKYIPKLQEMSPKEAEAYMKREARVERAIEAVEESQKQTLENLSYKIEYYLKSRYGDYDEFPDDYDALFSIAKEHIFDRYTVFTGNMSSEEKNAFLSPERRAEGALEVALEELEEELDR